MWAERPLGALAEAGPALRRRTFDANETNLKGVFLDVIVAEPSVSPVPGAGVLVDGDRGSTRAMRLASHGLAPWQAQPARSDHVALNL